MTKSNKLHILGFCLVLLALLSLVAYQLFVTPNFTRIPFSQFFSQSTLKKITYQPPDIGQPQNFPDPNPLSLACQPTCNFVLDEQIIKAKIDNDPEALITSLSLKFFDLKPGFIGYQSNDPNNPTFFVLNLDGQLLQTIRLNLNQLRLLEFVNYHPETQEIMFKSTHQDNQFEEHWLYSANSPSLRQITL